MRILSIRGRNLASLAGDFEVELDAPPLSQAGLFAISGPTGAGKSTILDALCLALFDRIPRVPRGRHSKVEVGRADAAPETRIKITDVRSILRHGASEGTAEVEFLDNHGHRFRARWQVHRARGRADGRLQQQVITLEDMENGQLIGSNNSEVLTAISERLGLSFDQFRRSVLLAQGEFAAFLAADAKVRSELLERITGTAIYSRISVACHRREVGEREQLRLLEAQLEGCEVLDDDGRAELEARRCSAKAELEGAESAVASAARDRAYYERLGKLQITVTEATEAHAAAEQAWIEAAPARQELEAITAAQPMRPLLDACDTAAIAVKEAAEAHDQAKSAAKTALQIVEQRTSLLEEAERAFETTEVARKEQRPGLARARDLETQLNGRRERIHQVQADMGSAEQGADAAQSELHRISKERRQLLERREKSKAWLNDNQHLALLGQRWDRWQALLERLVQAHHERHEAETRAQSLWSQAEVTAVELAAARSADERALAARAEDVAGLRSTLVDGDPCPVCGATEHPWAHRKTETEPISAESSAHDYQPLPDSDQPVQTEQLQMRHVQLTTEAKSCSEAAQAALTGWQEAVEKLGEALAGIPGWQRLAEEAPKTLVERSATHADQWRGHSAAVDEIDATVHGLDPKLATAESKAQHTQDEVLKLKQQLEAERSAASALELELHELTGGRSAADTEAALESTVAEARQRAASARHELAQAQQASASADQNENGTRKLLDAHRGHLEAARANLHSALDGGPVDADTARRLLAHDDAWIAAETERFEKLNRSRRELQIRLDERRSNLREHRDTDPPGVSAEHATDAFRQAEAEHERTRASFTECELELRRDDDGRERRAALGAHLEAQSQRWQIWASLKALIGSADGSKLRGFAQSLTLDTLLNHANQHLQELARRYRLQRVPGTDLELQVVDRDMADEVRSVFSLSGGESFLISLALALGLASLSSRRTRVESLFIDEGFGSLDAASLDTAVASLDALQSTGRQVGVISHVGVMVERIGFQVLVEAKGGGRSTVRVTGG